jgi:phosphoadenosine phosphosulfate reductase
VSEAIRINRSGQPPIPTTLASGDWLLPRDLDAINADFETRSAAEIIRWAWQRFSGGLLASSSFQTQSVPLLHLIAQQAPRVEVCFLDTGYHFPETIVFRDRLTAELDLNVRVLRADQPDAGQVGELYRSDPDRCCFINKVEPLRRALAGKRAWLTGIRRDQTASRKQANTVERQPDGIYKISPMLTWTAADTADYITAHDLPEHPLTSLGFASVGCEPCTRSVEAGEDARAGRWAQGDKVECGLHLDIKRKDRSS